MQRHDGAVDAEIETRVSRCEWAMAEPSSLAVGSSVTAPRQIDLLDDGLPHGAHRPELAAVARALPQGVSLGTSSWSFPGWMGVVYDRHAQSRVLAQHGLRAYAQHPILGLAGVDRSYYGSLPVSAWRNYAEQVPPGFRFLIKAPWTATCPTQGASRAPNPHFLEPGPVRDAIGEVHDALGDKLAAVVCQFPPTRELAADAFAARLRRFLVGLPGDVPIATEVRTPGWLGPAYAGALSDTGAVHCYSVHPRMPGLAAQAQRLGTVPPGPFVARWNLGHGQRYEAARERYAPFDRIVDPAPETRAELVDAVCAAVDIGEAAYVAINNKAEGCAPLSAEALARAIVERRSA